ncbi:hypothetical protein SO694_00049296 [Aureococcus anophagefferens]|uniref:Uncharacterized protein n=1 Tax=Aureococcus anophagefferens TaxID=44056 RepID=A0ABR1G868_AURAN
MVVVDLPALPDERGRWGAEGEDSWGDAVAWLAREPGAFRPPGPPRVVAFVAHNGLCNRLAGLGGLWALADHYGAAFELLWEGEIACQGAFSELYDDADGLAVVDGARVQELRDAPDCWVFDTKRASHFWTAPWTFLLSTEAGAPDFASFDAAARRCLGRLAPSAAVRGAVNGFLSLGPWGLLDLSRRTVGVHVRGTDHETFHDGAGTGFHDGFAAYASTVDRFEAEIGALLRGAAPDPGHPVVFLAADARGTVDRVLATFRAAADDGRLVVLDKRFATPHACLKVVRHTSSVDALADLYLLARCTSILGTFQSSFSELAAVLGGVPARCPGLPPRLRASLNLYAATGALVGVLRPGEDVVAVREATSSEGVDRVWVAGRGWVSARVLEPRRDAKGDHAAALAAYQAERHARYTADHARWNAELLALVATGAVKLEGNRVQIVQAEA